MTRVLPWLVSGDSKRAGQPDQPSPAKRQKVIRGDPHSGTGQDAGKEFIENLSLKVTLVDV